MSEPKYPNADTSPERLAEITERYREATVGYISDEEDFIIRDLLAMLHEHSAYKDLYAAAVTKASQYLQCGGEFPGLLPLGRNILMDGFPAMAAEIRKLRAELYEQRWRKLSEEMPPKRVYLQVTDNDDCGADHWELMNEIKIKWMDGNGEFHYHHPKYWRPIPPLPKE